MNYKNSVEKIKYKISGILSNDAKYIREKVFIEEQGFQYEFDEIDEYALHIVGYVNETPIATCRLFKSKNNNIYVLGRLAVLKEYRKQGIGKNLLYVVEKIIKKENEQYLTLHAQCGAKIFYEKSGYKVFGEIDYEEACPHIWMIKDLNDEE